MSMGRKKYIVILLLVLLAGGIFLFLHMKGKAEKNVEDEIQELDAEQPEEEKEVKSLGVKVVIDSGHGGFDPGKVNSDGMIEKDINLQIAMKLKAELESQGIEVIMTRDSDKGLYEETSRSKKMEDLENRCKLIGETEPICTVSIHQNSFPDETVYGPQVFYYHTSESSAQLAQLVQDSLNTNLAIEKPRETKNNQSYYMLKKSPSTTIIVECGFLSNPTEAQKLSSEDYQAQIAAAIRQGVMEYVTPLLPGNEQSEQSTDNSSASESSSELSESEQSGTQESLES